MLYKRKEVGIRQEPHGLWTDFNKYGQLSMQMDDPFVSHHLEDLHDKGNFALTQLERIIKKIQTEDLSEYRIEVAQRKKAEQIHKARLAILSFMKERIEADKEEVMKVKNAILRLTEVPEEKDPAKAMRQELRLSEIRNIIRSLDPKDRPAMIKQNMGNVEFLQACVTSPDEIIDQDFLLNARREYAFQIDPSLQQLEADTILLYMATRKRAGEINASSLMMLMEEDFEDPISPVEHFDCFMPDSGYERYWAEKKLRRWQSDQDAAERRAHWEEHNKGIDFQSGIAPKKLNEQRQKEFNERRNPNN